jgi:hypothetical protein
MIGPFGSRRTRLFLVCGVIAVALFAGCSQVPSVGHQEIELTSCVDGAFTVQFDLVYSNSFVASVSVESQSSNVVGTPLITPTGPNSFLVTAELGNAGLGDPVSIGFAAQVQQFGFAQATNVRWYTDPPQSIGQPACGPRGGLEFETTLSPVQGLVLEVSNPTPVPIELLSLELVASPVLLPPHQLDWSDSSFNALPWQAAFPGGIVVAPGAPALSIDLPESAPPGTAAVLCRCVYMESGGEPYRCITEIDMVGRPIAVKSVTWSEVKALSR